MDHGTSKRSGFLRIYNFHTGEYELGAVLGGAIQKCKVMLKLNVLEREREREREWDTLQAPFVFAILIKMY